MRGIAAAAALTLALGCAGHRPPPTPYPPDTSHWRGASDQFVVDITVSGTIRGVLDPAALAAENARLGLPADTPPTLMVWSASPGDTPWQDTELQSIAPVPTRFEPDPEHGNLIAQWDLNDRLAPGTEFSLTRRYLVLLYDYAPPLTPEPGRTADPERVAIYTRSEPHHEATPAMREAAAAATAGLDDPAARARALFERTRAHMTYEYPPPGGRGSTIAFEQGRGDCGQYADLFIALCRAEGIPTRFVGGLSPRFADGATTATLGSHAWAELMLPDGRWVPADPTGEPDEFFGRLTNTRHWTMSVGRNIALPGVPEWARAGGVGEVMPGGTADLMQTYTVLAHGVDVSWRSTRQARRVPH